PPRAVLSLCLHLFLLPQGGRDKLSCVSHLVWREKAGDNDSKQPHSPFAINQPRKQCAENRQHFLRRLESLHTAGGSCYQLERTPTHLKGQCPPRDAQFRQA